MNSIAFKRLYIFSPLEELAKIVELRPGLNVVTSLRKDGNDLGKSIIAKSFYHCLGADCLFDRKFDSNNKIFALLFEYGDKEYTIYRSNTLFKLLNGKHELLWETSHRHKLAQLLYEQFGFAMWLQARNTKEIEIAPPAFSYAPYFIDQNQYNGSNFSSFDNLGQYKDYKGNLIYTFTGAYDENYFEVKAQRTPLESKLKDINESLEVNTAMSDRIGEELAGLGYSASMESLNLDCDEHEEKYKRLSEQLGKLRAKLYELREKRTQILLAIEGSNALAKHLDKRIASFDGNTCPFCNNVIEDQIALRVSTCVTHTDVLLLGDELNKELDNIEREIERKEAKYEQFLSDLQTLKSAMHTIRENDLTAIQIEGLTKLDEKLTYERGKLEKSLNESDKKLAQIKKLLADYAESRSAVNDRYIELITWYTKTLNLQSIDLGTIKGITDRFKADGSNAPLATVAWYFSLLRLKEEFNPKRINLPLILDSPMNVEADDEKYDMHYRLIFDTFKYQHQMLVTGLGLASSTVVPNDANIIVLENKKYELLNREDFERSKELIFACMEKHIYDV